MKSLVVYFSNTGNTKKVAEELAKKLNADLDEMEEAKKRSFIGTWVMGSHEAMKEEPSKVIFSKNPQDYDLVVLGGPVWAWNLIPPLRGYLNENKDKISKLGFFLTCGGNPGKNFEQVEAIKKPIATMLIIEKDLKEGSYKEKIEEFVEKLKQLSSIRSICTGRLLIG